MSGRSNWIPIVLVDEAGRNLAANRIRTALLVVLAIATMSGAAVWEVSSIDAARRDEDSLIDRGRTTVVLETIKETSSVPIGGGKATSDGSKKAKVKK